VPDREQPPIFENGQDIRDRTFAFGCEVARFCEGLHQRGGNARVLAPQSLRSSTAIASMLEEAKAAESKADFMSMGAVGLKEARESLVRLRTCVELGYGAADTAAGLSNEANQIVAIITAILRNTRRNLRDRGTNSNFLILNSEFRVSAQSRRTKPRRVATRTASVRLVTPSFSNK
jgi:four helix bundle protein